MKPILSPNLSAGLEVGWEIPISSWKKEWENAAGDIFVIPPEVTEYTEIDLEILGWLDEPEEEYTQLLELKQRILVVPILGKFAYAGGGRMKVGAALAFGAYVINSRITGTMTMTYVQDSTKPWNPWPKKGDEITEEWTGYEPIDWQPPASPELTTFEQKFDVGGLSFGGGLSLNFFF